MAPVVSHFLALPPTWLWRLRVPPPPCSLPRSFNNRFTDKMRRIKIPLPPIDEKKKVRSRGHTAAGWRP